MSGKYVVTKEIKPEELVKDGVKAVYEIGFGGIVYGCMSAVVASCHPVVRLCAKLGSVALGAAYGKVLYDFVDQTFDIEDKIDGLFRVENKEAAGAAE